MANWFCSVFNVVSRKLLSSPRCKSVLIDSAWVVIVPGQKCIKQKNIYALARISHYLDEQKRKMLMKSFVISQFNYCPIIWMYCQRKSNNLINRIHERALRIAYNDNSVTINHRNIQALATEIYKTLNDLNPVFMKEIFSLKTHCYPLRI